MSNSAVIQGEHYKILLQIYYVINKLISDIWRTIHTFNLRHYRMTNSEIKFDYYRSSTEGLTEVLRKD